MATAMEISHAGPASSFYARRRVFAPKRSPLLRSVQLSPVQILCTDPPALFAIPRFQSSGLEEKENNGSGDSAGHDADIVQDREHPYLGRLLLFKCQDSPRPCTERNAAVRSGGPPLLVPLGDARYYRCVGAQNLYRFESKGLRDRITQHFENAAVLLPCDPSLRDYLRVFACLGSFNRQNMDALTAIAPTASEELSFPRDQRRMLESISAVGTVCERILVGCATEVIGTFICSCALNVLTFVLQQVLDSFFGLYGWTIYSIDGELTRLLNDLDKFRIMEFIRRHPKGVVTRMVKCSLLTSASMYEQMFVMLVSLENTLSGSQVNGRHLIAEQTVVRHEFTMLLTHVADLVSCLSYYVDDASPMMTKYGTLPMRDDSFEHLSVPLKVQMGGSCTSGRACLNSL